MFLNDSSSTSLPTTSETPTTSEEILTTSETPITTVTIECSEGEDCSYTCDNSNNCDNTVIECPSDDPFVYSCSVRCSGTNSCINTVIRGEYSSSLSVSCRDGSSSCSNIEIYAPVTTNDASLSSIISNFEFIVRGGSGAVNTYINASYTSAIYIDCFGSSSCSYMTLDVTNSLNVTMEGSQQESFGNLILYGDNLLTDLLIECESEHSCNNQELHLNNSQCNIYIDCQSQTNACEYSKYYIPYNSGNNAIFRCRSCGESLIDARYKTIGNLDVRCSDSDGCLNTIVYVNEDTESVSNTEYYNLIRCSGDTSCKGLIVFSESGFDYDNDAIGLEFECSDNENCNNVTVHCGEGYPYTCRLEYDPSYLILFDEDDENNNGIICVGRGNSYSNCGQTNLPTTAPTDPTQSPTFEPTQPTLQPSVLPSLSPTTLDPTSMPVVQPTSKPTKEKKGGGGSNNNDNGSFSDNLGIYIGVFVGCAVIIGLGVTVFCVLLTREEEKRKEEQQREREENERRAIENMQANANNVVAVAAQDNNATAVVTGMSGQTGGGGNNNVQNNATTGDEPVEVEMGAMKTTTTKLQSNTSGSGQYSVSPAVRAHQIKQERKELGLDDEDDELPAYSNANDNGYGRLKDDDEEDDKL